jgi:hypothetical protein
MSASFARVRARATSLPAARPRVVLPPVPNPVLSKPDFPSKIRVCLPDLENKKRYEHFARDNGLLLQYTVGMRPHPLACGVRTAVSHQLVLAAQATTNAFKTRLMELGGNAREIRTHYLRPTVYGLAEQQSNVFRCETSHPKHLSTLCACTEFICSHVARSGVFLMIDSVQDLTPSQINELTAYGPIYCSYHRFPAQYYAEDYLCDFHVSVDTRRTEEKPLVTIWSNDRCPASTDLHIHANFLSDTPMPGTTLILAGSDYNVVITEFYRVGYYFAAVIHRQSVDTPPSILQPLSSELVLPDWDERTNTDFPALSIRRLPYHSEQGSMIPDFIVDRISQDLRVLELTDEALLSKVSHSVVASLAQLSYSRCFDPDIIAMHTFRQIKRYHPFKKWYDPLIPYWRFIFYSLLFIVVNWIYGETMIKLATSVRYMTEDPRYLVVFFLVAPTFEELIKYLFRPYIGSVAVVIYSCFFEQSHLGSVLDIVFCVAVHSTFLISLWLSIPLHILLNCLVVFDHRFGLLMFRPPKPRQIASCSPYLLAAFGCFCHTVEKQACKYFRSFVKNLDIRAVSAIVAKFRQPFFGDQSSFELHQNPSISQVVAELEGHLTGDLNSARALYKTDRRWKSYNRNRSLRFSVEGVRASGSPQTSVSNNLYSILCHLFLLVLRNPGSRWDRLPLINNGDDAVVDGYGLLLPSADDYTALGLSFCWQSGTEFCRCIFISNLGMYVRHPKELLARIGFNATVRLTTTYPYRLTLAKNIALAYLQYNLNVPIYTALFVSWVNIIVKIQQDQNIPDVAVVLEGEYFFEMCLKEHLNVGLLAFTSQPTLAVRIEFANTFEIPVSTQFRLERMLMDNTDLYAFFDDPFVNRYLTERVGPANADIRTTHPLVLGPLCVGRHVPRAELSTKFHWLKCNPKCTCRPHSRLIHQIGPVFWRPWAYSNCDLNLYSAITQRVAAPLTEPQDEMIRQLRSFFERLKTEIPPPNGLLVTSREEFLSTRKPSVARRFILGEDMIAHNERHLSYSSFVKFEVRAQNPFMKF